jgi:exodeoxyribonuclease VII large subunit
LRQIVGQRLTMDRQRAQSFTKRIQSLDPELALKRGYTIVYRNQKIVPSVAQLSAKEHVTVKFRDGEAESVVESVKKT